MLSASWSRAVVCRASLECPTARMHIAREQSRAAYDIYLGSRFQQRDGLCGAECFSADSRFVQTPSSPRAVWRLDERVAHSIVGRPGRDRRHPPPPRRRVDRPCPRALSFVTRTRGGPPLHPPRGRERRSYSLLRFVPAPRWGRLAWNPLPPWTHDGPPRRPRHLSGMLPVAAAAAAGRSRPVSLFCICRLTGGSCGTAPMVVLRLRQTPGAPR